MIAVVGLVLSAQAMDFATKAKTVGIALVNTIDLKKNQHLEIEKAFNDVKKREPDVLQKRHAC